MAALLNRAKMTTATTGTGTVTLGSAVTAFLTFAEAGAVNATVYSYVIEDGNDVEYGIGTYTTSGTLFSRDTVTGSKIGGTAGTSKINLSGSAIIAITALAADIVTPTGTQTLSNKTLDGATLPVTYSDDGAGEGPVANLLRNSASPAASDIIGALALQGKDSAANTETYAKIFAQIVDPTTTSEDGLLALQTIIAGTLASRVLIGHGLYTPSVTGGDKGANSANIETLYQANAQVKTVGKETIWIPAGALIANVGAAPTAYVFDSGSENNIFRTWQFSASSTQAVQFAIGMPKSWDKGPVTVEFEWTAEGGSAGNVVWYCNAYAYSNDDALNTARGGTQSVTDAWIANGDLHVTAETPAITISGTPANGDVVLYEFGRDAANGSDTFATTSLLIAVKILFNTNASTDA